MHKPLKLFSLSIMFCLIWVIFEVVYTPTNSLATLAQTDNYTCDELDAYYFLNAQTALDGEGPLPVEQSSNWGVIDRYVSVLSQKSSGLDTATAYLEASIHYTISSFGNGDRQFNKGDVHFNGTLSHSISGDINAEQSMYGGYEFHFMTEEDGFVEIAFTSGSSFGEGRLQPGHITLVRPGTADDVIDYAYGTASSFSLPVSGGVGYQLRISAPYALLYDEDTYSSANAWTTVSWTIPPITCRGDHPGVAITNEDLTPPPVANETTFIGEAIEKSCGISPSVQIQIDKNLPSQKNFYAELILPAFDVDYIGNNFYPPERNVVLVNGNELEGYLVGDDGGWETNVFRVPIELINFPEEPGEGEELVPANNHISVKVDELNIPPIWCTALDWAALTFRDDYFVYLPTVISD